MKSFIGGHFGNNCKDIFGMKEKVNSNCRKQPKAHFSAWRQVPELADITSKMRALPVCVDFARNWGYKL